MLKAIADRGGAARISRRVEIVARRGAWAPAALSARISRRVEMPWVYG